MRLAETASFDLLLSQGLSQKKFAAFEVSNKEAEALRSKLGTDGYARRYAGVAITEYGGEVVQIQIREEFSDAGYWLPAIVTDADGRAIAKIPMPEKTTEWRLTARGCTVETLVGQAKANTITRKDFFVDIKTPLIVTEGDKIRVLGRVDELQN
ncbi:hypothetical protein H8E77_15405 [bacterium]|nr:hypothetical protein [bacterium]